MYANLEAEIVRNRISKETIAKKNRKNLYHFHYEIEWKKFFSI